MRRMMPRPRRDRDVRDRDYNPVDQIDVTEYITTCS